MTAPKQHPHPSAPVVAKALADDAFKARLLSDPAATLRAEGIAVPEGVTIKVVENTDALIHIVLPRKPSEEIADADLARVAGGWDDDTIVTTLELEA